MSTAFVPDTAPVCLHRDGYWIIRSAALANRIRAIDNSLDYDFAATVFCVGKFSGGLTKRFERMLIRTPATRAFAMPEAILLRATSILSPGCDRIARRLTQAVEIHPGAPAQYSHRDHDLWPAITGGEQFQVNVIWQLPAITVDNGATRFWPGSDYAGFDGETEEGVAALAACEPGDALVWLYPSPLLAGATPEHAPAVDAFRRDHAAALRARTQARCNHACD